MKTIFDTMHVNYAEYAYFKKLPNSEKINFFFELCEISMIREENPNINLDAVFDMIHDSIKDSPEQAKKNLPADAEYIEVMIDDNNVLVESSSLKAIKEIVYRFFESGYILQRDRESEKMFKQDKVTKYLRVFKIVDQITTLCTN